MAQDQLIALFDMDGTLCNYTQSMRKELKKLKSPQEPDIDPFLVGDDPAYKYLWSRMDLIKSDEEWWANLPKVSLGFDLMSMALEIGFYCELLTQSPRNKPAALAGKLKWIRKNIKGYIDYTMTRNKSRHYGNVLVDDYPGNILSWLKYRKRGIVIMPDTKYNQEFSHPRVIRYTGKNKKEVKEALRRTHSPP